MDKHVTRTEQEHIRHSRLVHKSTVAALALVLLLALFARHIEVTNRFELDPADSNLILIALKTVAPKKPEPPAPEKPMVVPPPLRIIEEPDEVPDVITTKIKPVPKRRKRPRAQQTRLDLDHDTDLSDTNTPAIGELSGPNARDQRRAPILGTPDLKTDLREQRLEHNAGPGDFALGSANTQPRREVAPAPSKMEFDIKREAEPEATHENDASIADFLNADVSLVLTSSDLSMGVEEYKIWNKINAEFDRWDKGRYGALPKVMQRRGRAMVATFQYADGSGHRFVWLRGNTKLYVHGQSQRDRVAELQQALMSIIHLNTKRGRL